MIEVRLFLAGADAGVSGNAGLTLGLPDGVDPDAMARILGALIGGDCCAVAIKPRGRDVIIFSASAKRLKNNRATDLAGIEIFGHCIIMTRSEYDRLRLDNVFKNSA